MKMYQNQEQLKNSWILILKYGGWKVVPPLSPVCYTEKIARPSPQ